MAFVQFRKELYFSLDRKNDCACGCHLESVILYRHDCLSSQLDPSLMNQSNMRCIRLKIFIVLREIT